MLGPEVGAWWLPAPARGRATFDTDRLTPEVGVRPFVEDPPGSAESLDTEGSDGETGRGTARDSADGVVAVKGPFEVLAPPLASSSEPFLTLPLAYEGDRLLSRARTAPRAERDDLLLSCFAQLRRLSRR